MSSLLLLPHEMAPIPRRREALATVSPSAIDKAELVRYVVPYGATERSDESNLPSRLRRFRPGGGAGRDDGPLVKRGGGKGGLAIDPAGLNRWERQYAATHRLETRLSNLGEGIETEGMEGGRRLAALQRRLDAAEVRLRRRRGGGV